MDIRPHEADRVLFLTLPGADVIRTVAERVPLGLVVGIGPDQSVRESRRALADLDNVMLIPSGAPGDPIPWQDGFFTKLVAPDHREVEPEMLRVTAPGGVIYVGAGADEPELAQYAVSGVDIVRVTENTLNLERRGRR